MAKKIDAVSEGYYAPFFTRGKQRNNPVNNEESLLVTMYERILGELAMNRFQWKGFPDYVDLRFIELTLHQYGLVVVFKDTGTTTRPGRPGRPGTDRIFALRGTPTGQRTITDNPVSFTLTGPGMDQRFQGVVLSSRACVPIWPNFFRRTDWDIISVYSRKLAKIDRTIDINMDNARRTKVLIYDENTRLTAENLNRQLNEGQATVRLKYDPGSMVTSVDLGVDPKSLESLSVLRARLWSEAMGLLGINNANQDKKERLVESEVDANIDQVENMRRVNLNARQFACEQMAKMFPDDLANVSVDYYTDIAPDAGLPEIGGDEDANVYDGTMAGN